MQEIKQEIKQEFKRFFAKLKYQEVGDKYPDEIIANWWLKKIAEARLEGMREVLKIVEELPNVIIWKDLSDKERRFEYVSLEKIKDEINSKIKGINL